MFATDEHRIGLKPVIRRVWAPVGERPVAVGHHRFEWLYVTVFVAPASGETFWYLSNGVSKPFFAALLELFAREAGAGRERRIVLQLDNAGWHSEAGLEVPEGIRLVYLPLIRLNCNRPRRSGRWSTSRSSTGTSRRSRSWSRSSPAVASTLPGCRIRSDRKPGSTGGQILAYRSDHPESV